MKKLVDIYGWCGMTAIVVAYALVSFSVIKPEGLTYQILNGAGALGIVLISFVKRAYQPAILNLIWTIIAAVAIVKIVY